MNYFTKLNNGNKVFKMTSINELLNKIRTLECTINSKTSEINSKNSEINSLKSENNTLKSENNSLKSENNTLKTNRESINSEKMQFQDKCSDLTRENMNMKSELNRAICRKCTQRY